MIRNLFIIILSFSLFTTSCIKEKDYFLPDGTLEFVGDVQALKLELRPDPINYSFEMPTEETIIPFTEDFHLILQQGSLLDQNGEVYTGEVNALLRKANSPSEWAGWDFSLITEDGFLDAISSQKILFHSSENNKLMVNEDSPPVIRWVTLEEKDKVALFRFDQQDKKWKFFSAEVQFTEREMMVNNEPEMVAAYEFSLLDYGWYTIGVELLKPQGSNLCMNHPEGFTKSNTTSFVIFENYNTVIMLNDWDEDNPYKNCNQLLRLPINEDLKVASIAGISGNRYFFDLRSINLNSSEIELEMDPKRLSFNQILNRLNAR